MAENNTSDDYYASTDYFVDADNLNAVIEKVVDNELDHNKDHYVIQVLTGCLIVSLILCAMFALSCCIKLKVYWKWNTICLNHDADTGKCDLT